MHDRVASPHDQRISRVNVDHMVLHGDPARISIFDIAPTAGPALIETWGIQCSLNIHVEIHDAGNKLRMRARA